MLVYDFFFFPDTFVQHSMQLYFYMGSFMSFSPKTKYPQATRISFSLEKLCKNTARDNEFCISVVKMKKAEICYMCASPIAYIPRKSEPAALQRTLTNQSFLQLHAVYAFQICNMSVGNWLDNYTSTAPEYLSKWKSRETCFSDYY